METALDGQSPRSARHVTRRRRQYWTDSHRGLPDTSPGDGDSTGRTVTAVCSARHRETETALDRQSPPSARYVTRRSRQHWTDSHRGLPDTSPGDGDTYWTDSHRDLPGTSPGDGNSTGQTVTAVCPARHRETETALDGQSPRSARHVTRGWRQHWTDSHRDLPDMSPGDGDSTGQTVTAVCPTCHRETETALDGRSPRSARHVTGRRRQHWTESPWFVFVFSQEQTMDPHLKMGYSLVIAIVHVQNKIFRKAKYTLKMRIAKTALKSSTSPVQHITRRRRQHWSDSYSGLPGMSPGDGDM